MDYLFEKDPVDWSKMDHEFVRWIKSLAKLKKEPIFAQNFGYKLVEHYKEVLHFEYENEHERLIALCNVSNAKGMIQIDCPEGEYHHLITNELIDIRFGQIKLSSYPILFRIKK
jgi:hypothetical protein